MPTRLSLRRRFAALGLVGAVMVLLPLVQVLRYQDAQLQAALAQQAALDPLLLAVDTQRALLDHQPLAARVLRGQAEAEAARQAVQGQADERVFRLDMAVAMHGDAHAMQESDALRQDWHRLARGVQARALSVPASDGGHRLLVEQVLQLVDLLTLGAWTPAAADPTAPGLAALAAQRVPRLAVALAALDEREDAPLPRALAAALVRDFEALAHGASALAVQDTGAAALLARRASEGAAAARSGARAPAGSAAALEARRALHAAHAGLAEPLRQALAPRLQARVAALQRQRVLTLAGSALLAALAGGLLAGLPAGWWRRAARRDARTAGRAPPLASPAAPRASDPRAQSHALLARLRGPEAGRAPRPDPLTLPPDD